MRQIKCLTLCVVLTLCSICANAYNFEVDGIYYNVVSSSNLTCEVTYKSSSYNTYSGSVTIPETVKRSSNGYTYTVVGIGSSAFRNSANLKSITIPNSVTSIGNEAFYYCITLSEITIPSSVVSIGSKAFLGCTNLTKVTLEDGEETLSMTTSSYYSPFTGISSSYSSYSCPIETLYQGRNISYTSPYAPFRGQTSLKSLTIGESVTNIGDYAFYECSSLTSVYIPDGVTNIGQYAFYECKYLTSVTIGNSVTSIEDYTFAGCTRLTSITIPDGVTNIGQYALYECRYLTSINIPESVTTIGNRAFYNCLSLTSITIPAGVTEIGNSAFSGCLSLASITSLNMKPPTCGSSCFDSVPKGSCVLYVPKGSYEAYVFVDQWKDFTNIEEIDVTPVIGIEADDEVEELYRYTIDGKRIYNSQKGINIIKYSDGTTKKVLVK